MITLTNACNFPNFYKNIMLGVGKWASRDGSYSARAAGSQVEGTSCFTLSDKVICDLSNSIVYKPICQPSKARILEVDASICQLPLKLNIELNIPEGILPDRDNSWLKCSDIWTYLSQAKKALLFDQVTTIYQLTNKARLNIIDSSSSNCWFVLTDVLPTDDHVNLSLHLIEEVRDIINTVFFSNRWKHDFFCLA